MNEIMKWLIFGYRIVFSMTYEFGPDAGRTYVLLEQPGYYSSVNRVSIWL